MTDARVAPQRPPGGRYSEWTDSINEGGAEPTTATHRFEKTQPLPPPRLTHQEGPPLSVVLDAQAPAALPEIRPDPVADAILDKLPSARGSAGKRGASTREARAVGPRPAPASMATAEVEPAVVLTDSIIQNAPLSERSAPTVLVHRSEDEPAAALPFRRLPRAVVFGLVAAVGCGLVFHYATERKPEAPPVAAPVATSALAGPLAPPSPAVSTFQPAEPRPVSPATAPSIAPTNSVTPQSSSPRPPAPSRAAGRPSQTSTVTPRPTPSTTAAPGYHEL